MKRSSRNWGLLALWAVGWIMAAGVTNLTAALSLVSVAESPAAPPPPAPWATNALPDTGVVFSPGVADVLKMMEAKVDPRVIQTYIQNSTVAYNPSVTEIIALKQRGVPDELVASMIQRGAQLRANGAQTPPPATSPVVPSLPPPAMVAPTPQVPTYAYDYATVPTYPAPAPAYNYDYPTYPPYYYNYSYYNYGYPWGWTYWPLYVNYGYYGGHSHGDQHPGHPGKSHPPGTSGSGPGQAWRPVSGPSVATTGRPLPPTAAGRAPPALSAPRAPSASAGSFGGRPAGAGGISGGARPSGGMGGGAGGRR
jgi:hypothetical protein